MTHRYQPQPASPDDIEQFGADISYISHASAVPSEFRSTLRAKWTGGAADFLPLLDGCLEEVTQSAQQSKSLEFLDLKNLAERVAASLKLPLPPNVLSALMTDMRLLADRIFRHQTLEWVSAWCQSHGKRLRIWGNGWNQHPTLSKWASGAALPGAQVHTVYRASTINLQIIETGILHSRLLDGWAAGGFFLIRQAHRPQDEDRIQTCYKIGTMAAKESITSIAEAESRGSAELRALWHTISPEYLAFRRDVAFPGFRMWRSLVPPQNLFPNLSEIMYNSPQEFARLADMYLASIAQRQASASRVNEVLDASLSYDARWRDFFGHIAANVGYST